MNELIYLLTPEPFSCPMNPVAIEFFGYQLRYYSLTYAFAMLFFYQVGRRDIKYFGIGLDADRFFNLIVWTFVGGLIGGRIYYVLFNLEHYTSNRVPWWEFAAIWHGGLAIHGGLIAGSLVLFFSTKAMGEHPIKVIDLFAVNTLLAQAIGRFGNFMNGDAHGQPTDMPWGMVFTHGPAGAEFPGIPLHPVMLYELVLNLIGWMILRWMMKNRYRPGIIATGYVLAYSIIRGIVTNFRADDFFVWGMRVPLVVSIAGFFLGIAMLLGLKYVYKDEWFAPKPEKAAGKKGR